MSLFRLLSLMFVTTAICCADCPSSPNLSEDCLLGSQICKKFDPKGYCDFSKLDNVPRPRAHEGYPIEPFWKGKINKEQIEILLAIYVNSNGRIDEVIVLKSKYSKVGEYIKKSVSRWVFEVGFLNGKPVDFVYITPVEVRLE